MNFDNEVLVVDLEATCWDDPRERGDQPSDIIEIGVCTVNLQTGKIDKPRGILVQPARSTISKFCTQLTSLTPEQIAHEGVSYKEACDLLATEYQAGRKVWLSYGDYDRKMVEAQCHDLGVPYPFGPRHGNVKLDFALRAGLTREVGMAQALKICHLKLDGHHHRGVDDALNIAKLALRVYSPL